MEIRKGSEGIMMSVEELLNRYTPDARERVIMFLIFMKKFAANQSSEDYRVLDRDDNSWLEGFDNAIFYFIYVLFYTKSDAFEILKQNGACIENAFKVSARVEEDMATIMESFNGFSMEQLEDCYNGSEFARVLLLTFSKAENGKNVSLERMLVNLERAIRSIPKLSAVLRIGESVEKLSRLAERKEMVKTIYTDDLPDFAKALSGITLRLNSEIPKTSNGELGFGEELTRKEYEYNPLMGREKELRQLGALLLDEEKSVVVYGNPGVGKTALVNGLAYQIQNGMVNELLRKKRIYEVSASELVAGTKYRGDFEKRLLEIINKLIDREDSILYIDEIHTLMGLGSTMDRTSNDAANILKPYLGNGRLKIIGGTTVEEYRILQSDRAFDRRFIGLYVSELSRDDLRALLNNVIDRYKRVKAIDFAYPDDVRDEFVKLLLELSQKEYQNPNRKLYNPDLSLTLLRLGYDFAMYDGKSSIDADSLVEGIGMTDYVNDEGKEHFKEMALRLLK